MREAAEPQVHHIYTKSGYEGPFPVYTEDSKDFEGELISESGSKPILRLSSELVVKFGAHVNVNEAESLLFVEKAAPTIPAPRIHACYLVGPHNRDPDDYGSLYDTFIIMEYVEGARLDQLWPNLSEAQKSTIAGQLCDHLRVLRAIPPDAQDVFCSVEGGPLKDFIFKDQPRQGPFHSENDLNAALATIQDDSNPKAHLRHLIEGALAQHKHSAVLTHGDLQGRNIMIVGDTVTGIIDWEWCGWYPEYWEFARCFRTGGWPKDWPPFVTRILQPYFLEWLMLDTINQHVW